MLSSLLAYLQSHPGMVSLAAAWAVREAHLWWPRLVSIYPYCRDNGGMVGIVRQLMFGSPKPQPTTTTEKL